METADNESYDEADVEELEKEAVALESNLNDRRAAVMMSESSNQLVAYVKKRQEGDMLVSGEEENRWKELITNEDSEPMDREVKTGCCTIA